MTKNEKVCEKEKNHCWNLDEIDVVDEGFDNVEIEIVCDRCGASAYLSGMFDDAPKNWKPLRKEYWERISKQRKEGEEYMIREAKKRELSNAKTQTQTQTK